MMINLYNRGTPNGRKVSIMLQTCEFPYRVPPVDISKDEQLFPAFVAINPEWHRNDPADYSNVHRWYKTIMERPAVQRGMAVPGAAI